MNERSIENEQAHSAELNNVTRVLKQWNDGDPKALDILMAEVLEQLKRIAERLTRDERSGDSLQPTELVNELYIRLRSQRKVEWENSSHFFAFASQLMRLILMDQARRRLAEKRGKGVAGIALEDVSEIAQQADADLLRLAEALQDLAKFDPRQRQIVELRFFAGLSVEEIGEVIGFSRATVIREWRTARLWILHQLEAG